MQIHKNLHFQTKLNQPSEEAKALPFYPLLPKDKIGILRWRLYVRQRSLVDLEFRTQIDQMCAQDCAFYAVTFAWIHETRDEAFSGTLGKFVFIPWTDQVDIFAWLQKYGGKVDTSIEKTRGIGLSWIMCIFMLWKWLYHGEHLDYGILSKDDDSLDIPGRPGSLMGKLDLLFGYLPAWKRLDKNGKSILHRTHSQHRFVNRVNQNAILGFTSSDDKLRSARLNFLFADEAAYLGVDTQRWLASTQHVGPRIWVSTHDGTATMFYRISIDSKSSLVRISTWWQANPARWQGAYIVKAGRVHILDTTYHFPPDYKFNYSRPGLERSVWVDFEFSKTGTDLARLEQEIYGVALLDTRKLLQPSIIRKARETCCPPRYRGWLNDRGEFLDDLDGDWYFWRDPNEAFTGMYFIGVDPNIGASIDGALAGVVVFDVNTGEQVCSAALKDVPPVDLARLVVALGTLLGGPRGLGYAQVVYESTGIGVIFTTEIKRLRYPAVYHEGNQASVHNSDRGEKILIELGRAIRDGDVAIRDERLVDDLECFEYDRKQELIHSGLAGHGDISQAAALAHWGMRQRRRAILEGQKPKKHAHPLLSEPRVIEAKKRAKIWSNKFRPEYN